MTETKTPPATQPVLGTSVSRYDGRDKVTGNARYAADFPVTGLAHGVLFHSSVARGRVTSIDTAAALKVPGVLAVLTHENVQQLYAVSMQHKTGKPGQTFLPMQGDEIRYAGQYLGVVVADTLDQAKHAADLIAVKYDVPSEPPSVNMDAPAKATFVPATMGRGEKPASERGDPVAAFGSAAVKIEQSYTTNSQSHNPIEMSATVAAWDGPKLTLHDATQWVYGVKSVVSTWLGIPADAVTVKSPFLGGGFGCKGSIWPHEVIAALAAKAVNRPVKIVLSRAQMFFGIGHRPTTLQSIKLGADANGRLVSVRHDCNSHTSATGDEWVETSTQQTRMLYSCPNLSTSQVLTPLHVNTPSQMRAPGHATGLFALEVAMDELAYAAGVDPLALRMANYADHDEGTKQPFSSKNLKGCYEQAAERFGWSKRNPEPGSMRQGEWLVGWGMATATYPTNEANASAQVQLLPSGNVVVSTAGHDIGTGAYTVLQQIAAEKVGVPLAGVKVLLGDTTLPEAPVAGGSQTTASVGSAVFSACTKLISDVKERAHADPASPLHRVPEGKMAVGDGRVFLASRPAVGELLSDLLKRSGNRPFVGKASFAAPAQAGSEDAGSGSPVERFSRHAWGAQFAEVQIHPRLREIKVTRLVGGFAAGRILNVKTAHSQLMGGMVWGISAALHEHLVYDSRTAKVVNDNLADYLVPVNKDVPQIEVLFVDEIDSNINPLGAKGIGELGVCGSIAAIANAVYHATGRRLRNTPITIEQVLT